MDVVRGVNFVSAFDPKLTLGSAISVEGDDPTQPGSLASAYRSNAIPVRCHKRTFQLPVLRIASTRVFVASRLRSHQAYRSSILRPNNSKFEMSIVFTQRFPATEVPDMFSCLNLV